MRHTLNLHIRPQRQLLDGHTRPRRFDFAREIRLVDFIHGSEIVHGGDEDADADDVVERGSCGFEDGGEVEETAVLDFSEVRIKGVD